MPDLLDPASFAAAARSLTGSDSDLARLVDDHGLPEFWQRAPGFSTLVLLILEQQVSLASAWAVYERLRAGLGDVTPTSVHSSSDGRLRTFGLTRQKARYVTSLAEAVGGGRLDLDRLPGLPDEEVRHILTSFTGIGPWTADVYLLACLRRPDIWPVGDRALQVAVRETLTLPAVPDASALARIGERWAPWRAVAARLLWHGYLARRDRTETPT